MKLLNIADLLSDDQINQNQFYTLNLPKDEVTCTLKIKSSEILIAGIPYLIEVFEHLGADKTKLEFLNKYEGKILKQNQTVTFNLPFNIALSGERLALNLLQRCSSIASYTNKIVEKSKKYNIKILDTRKTTPGLRSIEKYSVVVGGGYNHRFSQSDVWMIKDNHKSFFGGLHGAIKFFKSVHSFYNEIVCEIHSIDELKELIQLNKEHNYKVNHCLLDNFSKEQIADSLKIKQPNMTYEISGGVTLDNIENFLFVGIDAISVGALTHSFTQLDISMKIAKAK
ncbi:MAG: carboxylating nicotinate-nucleotide diphosphorylase [Bacteriovoracaceae bacterium]